MSEPTKAQMEIMRHALGLAPHMRPVDRNNFCEERGSEREKEVLALVERGLMAGGVIINDGRDRYYHVTDEGRKVVDDPRVKNAAGQWVLPERVYLVRVTREVSVTVPVLAWSEEGSQVVALDHAEDDSGWDDMIQSAHEAVDETTTAEMVHELTTPCPDTEDRDVFGTWIQRRERRKTVGEVLCGESVDE